MKIDITPLLNGTMTSDEWTKWIMDQMPKMIVMTPEYKKYMDDLLAHSKLTFFVRMFTPMPKKFTGQRFTQQ
jgi:hypothetical protein